MSKIVILTGAGISAESGLGTFRDEGGLWAQHRIEDVATPEGFARDPQLVHHFYNTRRRDCLGAQPNAAHVALAELEADPTHEVILVTQNVDDLHERAGSKAVIHMHGALLKATCFLCGHGWDIAQDMTPDTPCPSCGDKGARPDIVWFGEMPYHMEEIYTHIEAADLFVSIGTSGNVYPAAGFAHEAKRAGVATLELNLEATHGASAFDEARLGKASEIVPDWVRERVKK
ncbi:MAG: NAD-dependent deacylase [Halocynthiibacter sp.]